ncbi:MAG: pentulose/hexulose kinase [Friedmanniella sp.]|nr:pentulose/hexulose kinase [Friedmanniella sp.]
MTAPPGPLLIGIDCSTTGSKAVVFDLAGRTVSSASSPLATTSPHPGWHEQDAATWWPATDAAVRAALADLPDPGRVAAVCLTHQRESFVAVDADNTPRHPAILWLDARAAEEIAHHGTPEVERLCGKPADITPALYKLAWVRRHRPQWLDGAAYVLDTHAFLVRELTGRWVTSRSSADPLALLDICTRDYSPELLAVAGVDRDQLPELYDAGDLLGPLLPAVAQAWGLSAEVQVVAGLGDGQAAGLGADVLDASRAYLNLGTAVLVGTECPRYAPSRSYRTLLSVMPGQTTVETFLSSGTYLPTWFRRELGAAPSDGAPDPALEAAAAEVGPGSAGLLTLPYWNAAQTPHWDPYASGVMLGWRGSHTRAHAYRSLLEGIAQEVRLQLDGLEEANGVRVSTIRAMGGGTRSPLFRQILTDVLERPVEICGEPEISALGAAIVAAVGLGAHPDLATACRAMTRTGETITPCPEAGAVYTRLRSLHARVYPQLREVMHDLDSLVHDVLDPDLDFNPDDPDPDPDEPDPGEPVTGEPYDHTRSTP